MPPRFAYWTILVGGLPTAFRATEREELLPTFNRLQEKHPDAVMQWFSRGKLWESPAAAKAFFERGRVSHDGDKPRPRDWRLVTDGNGPAGFESQPARLEPGAPPCSAARRGTAQPGRMERRRR